MCVREGTLKDTKQDASTKEALQGPLQYECVFVHISLCKRVHSTVLPSKQSNWFPNVPTLECVCLVVQLIVSGWALSYILTYFVFTDNCLKQDLLCQSGGSSIFQWCVLHALLYSLSLRISIFPFLSFSYTSPHLCSDPRAAVEITSDNWIWRICI